MSQAPIASNQQFEKLIAAVRDGEFGLRDMSILSISFKMGLRAGEISNLNICDVIGRDNDFRQTLYVKPGKTKRSRELPFHPVVKEYLAEYLKTFIWKDVNEPLFISRVGMRFTKSTINSLFKRCFHKAGMPDFSSHSGRRTFATMMNKSGCDIRTLQKCMGHASISMTAVYIESTLEDMGNAMSRI